jgi:uncharacterized membrane protein YwaF
MKDFLHKFFGYFNYDGGSPEPFRDNLGKGAFSDWRHFAWAVLVIAVCILCYQLFKRKPKVGKIVVKVLVALLFTVRFINQIYRASIGAEVPAWRAFPFHLCTVMTFVLPIVVFFNIKKLKTPVYTLAMMGGIITVIMGDYFDNRFLTFSSLEGMSAHTLLILVPIIEVAVGGFRLELRNAWTVVVGLLVLVLWGTLANEVFFEAYDTNYMYLKRNGLPGNIGGDYYLLIYLGIFLILLAIILGVPTLYRKRKLK